MSPETRYRIEELEKLTGLSRRLIYDYISRDLVPPALGSGKGAYYIDEHFERLRLISLLRTMGFRLERIEEALETWSEEEISRIVGFAEGRDVESLDALNEWLTQPGPEEEPAVADLMRSASAMSKEASPREEAPQRYGSDEALRRMRELADHEMAAFEEASADEASADEARGATPAPEVAEYAAAKRVLPRASRLTANLSHRRPGAGSREEEEAPQTWRRVAINRDVEISYRADGSRDLLRRVRELIAGARELFKE